MFNGDSTGRLGVGSFKWDLSPTRSVVLKSYRSVASRSGRFVPGRWYDLRIYVNGADAKFSVDKKVVHSVE